MGKIPLTNPNSETLSLCGNGVRNETKEPFGIGLLEGNDWNERAGFLLRMDHGHPYRGDRIGTCGAGVVPIQAKTAFEILTGLGVL